VRHRARKISGGEQRGIFQMTPISGPPKASFQFSMLIYDTRFRSYTFQFIALILLMLLIGYLGANLMRNLSDQGQNISFGFLTSPANYDINQRPIEYDSQSTHLRAAIRAIG
jgi:general L-amino acid transport system permease protein